METKAREFWIDPDEDWDDEITVGLALKEHPRQGPLHWQASLIHVIEYSAYEKLEAENKKMREALSNIKEYWNGTYTVSALGDFADYAVDVCSEALEEEKK